MAASSYLNLDLSFNRGAILSAAHVQARASVDAAAKRGKIRRYVIALRDALIEVWGSAKVERECAIRDAALAVLPTSHVDLLRERTAALMIDSTVARDIAVAALDARAAVLGIRL